MTSAARLRPSQSRGFSTFHPPAGVPSELRDEEYTHNIMYKFLTLPSEAEREALLPVTHATPLVLARGTTPHPRHLALLPSPYTRC